MAGSIGLGPSEFLSVEETVKAAPTLDPKDLRGGILYHDGQFDDARMAVHLAMTATDHGATVLNYFPVEGLIKVNGNVTGVQVKDSLEGSTYEIMAKAVINATGVFTDSVLRMDNPDASSMVSPSQGIHLVFDKAFLPSDIAIMIPRTDDGRVLFAVPWHHKVVVGTTDTPVTEAEIEPRAREEEIDFILQHIRDYLTNEPDYPDIRSIFCGLRPLIKGNTKSTAGISREHQITISDSELISITGGKWTTYRRMAEDTVDVAMQKAKIPLIKSGTAELHIHGYLEETEFDAPLYYYGSDKEKIYKIMEDAPALAEKIHPAFPCLKAEVCWAVRHEMCMTLEDFMARRSRMLFLDAAASMEAAREVVNLISHELQKDLIWQKQQLEDYRLLANQYLPRTLVP
jgi:glycerol-3-phosphate dehydrogenase